MVLRAPCGDWGWRRSLGRAQRFRRVAAAGVRGDGPCMRPGCPGRAKRPGRLPKVFVQASHGSGAKKMAGLPNFCGAGEGREGRAGCQPRPRLFADPGRRSRAPPPRKKKKKLSLAQTFRPRRPRLAAAPRTRRVWGIPSRCLEAGGAGRSRGQLPIVLRPRRRVSRRRCADLGALRERVPPPAKFPAPCSVQGEGSRGEMSALPAHLPWRWLQAVRGHRRYPEPHRGPGSTVSWAMLWLATQTPQRDTSGPPSSAYQQSLRLWGGGISRPSLGY